MNYPTCIVVVVAMGCITMIVCTTIECLREIEIHKIHRSKR